MSLLDAIKDAAKEAAHERHLRGFDKARCEGCYGAGYFSTGSIWEEDEVRCRECNGHGFVEVPCSPAAQRAALRKEIRRLNKKLEALGKKRT